MSELSTLSQLQSKIADDPRVNVWHISLYTCLLNLWQQAGFQKHVKVNRKMLMAKAHIGSTSTYHKCINKLVKLDYIIYLPTYDCYKGSAIEIKMADQLNKL